MALTVQTKNPYRVLGVWVTDGRRMQERHRSEIEAHLSVGKGMGYEADMEGLLGRLSRTKESLQEAGGRLKKGDEALRYGQFWFIVKTEVDRHALEHLAAGAIDRALGIWGRTTGASALHNQVVTHLALNDYRAAIERAVRLYSQYGEELLHLVLGDSPTESSDKLVWNFLGVLLEELSARRLLAYIRDGEWRTLVVERAVATLTERLLAKAKWGRDAGVEEALQVGRTLMKEEVPLLEELRELLGEDDGQYQSVADKLAEGILQSSITHHNHHHTLKATRDTLPLVEMACKLARGPMASQRCEANRKTFEKNIEWHYAQNARRFL